MRRIVAAQHAKLKAQRLQWGSEGPPPNTLLAGQRVVAAYNELLRIRADATYQDFLQLFVKRVFGEEWWSNQLKLPVGEQHPLVTWQTACEQYMLDGSTGKSVVHERPMPAEAGSVLRLAFDLHQVRHLGLLLQSLVKRLKSVDQFQGARYEVAVAAAFARAGFKVELEAEGKGPDRKCEFVAIHRDTGHRYTVEAKSRHRPGVLGRPHQSAGKNAEPRVRSLIANALGKLAKGDRIICVDVNDPETFSSHIPRWVSVVRHQVDQLAAQGRGPALLIFTNSPYHFLPRGEPAIGQGAVVMDLNEPRYTPNKPTEVQSAFPGLLDAAIGFHLPVPGGWD